jgi:hypothetical protein
LPFQVRLPEQAAIEHDIWFRKQVRAAIVDADNPTTAFIPHEQIKKDWAVKRKFLVKQYKKRNQS